MEFFNFACGPPFPCSIVVKLNDFAVIIGLSLLYWLL